MFDEVYSLRSGYEAVFRCLQKTLVNEPLKIVFYNVEVQVSLIDYTRLVRPTSGRSEDVGTDVEVVPPSHNPYLILFENFT